MLKKFLFSFLILGFVSGIVLTGIYFLRTKNPVAISVPLIGGNVSPTEIIPQNTPTSIDPFIEKGLTLSDDFKKITDDLPIVGTEDIRLVPPDFYIEKEVLQ